MLLMINNFSYTFTTGFNQQEKNGRKGKRELVSKLSLHTGCSMCRVPLVIEFVNKNIHFINYHLIFTTIEV